MKEVGITHKKFFVVVIEDALEGGLDFILDLFGGYFPLENPPNRFPNQGLFLPIDQIVQTPQGPDAALGNAEGQEPEKHMVPIHLEKLAQAHLEFPERKKPVNLRLFLAFWDKLCLESHVSTKA